MKHLKLFFALFAMLALGVGNAWGETTTYVMYPDGGNTFNSEWDKTTRTARQTYASKVVVQMMKLNSGVYGEITSKNSVTNINAISVKCTANNAQNLTLYYSTDNSNWTELSKTSISKNTSSYSDYDIDVTGIPTTAYIKFRAEINSIYLYSITISTSEVATPDPVDPEVSFSNSTYTVGQTLDLSTLWTSNSDGAVTYSIVEAGTTGASINDKSFTASAAGTCIVKASQASTSSYNAITKTATITVTAPTPATITLSEAGQEKTVEGKYEGDSYELPLTSTQTCGTKTFVGWSTVEIATPGDKPTSKFYEPGTTVTLSDEQTFYAVYATEGEGAAEPEEVTWSYSFSSFSGTSVQYAEETHDLGGGVIIKIKGCHINTDNDDFRIYGSRQERYVISNKLPGTIKSMSFNVGNKADNLLVYGSTDGSTWTKVGSIATTTAYADKSIDFGETNYTYFKLDVEGANQLRLKKMSVTYMSAGGVTITYSDYTTSCGATPTIYNVTIADNIQNGTVTASPTSAAEGATITLTVTPADGYMLNTLAVADESSNLISVTDNKFEMPASNVTVSATFKEIPAAILTLSKNGDTSDKIEGKVGDVINLPTFTSDCSKTFVGWSADASCATAPEFAPGAEFELTATEHTLYAVYGTQTGGGDGVLTKMTSTDAFANGDKVVIVAYGTQLGMYQETSGTTYVKYWELVGNEPTVAELDDKTIWDVEADGENWKIGDATTGYLYNASNNNLAVSTTNASIWTITWKENGFVFKNDLGKYMACRTDLTGSNKNLYRMNGTTIGNNGVYEMDVYKYTSSAPIYSDYSTTCSAAPDAPEFSVAAGTYNAAQTVTITAEDGATIYYTLDGNNPTNESNVYSSALTISETTTLKAIAVKDGIASTVTTATYTINLPLTTMDQIFAKASDVKSTVTPVEITFGNWVVSAVKEDGKTAYLTDGTKGLIIYTASHGFKVGDILSGTVACKVQLFKGSAELTELTATTEGLTITKGGTVSTVVVDDVTTLSGVNTGSVIKINGVHESDNIVNNVKLYNTLFSFENLTPGQEYNVTGVYLQYDATKEILPRSAADIEEVVGLPTATISIENITLVEGDEHTIVATITPDEAASKVTYSIKNGDEYISLVGNMITANAVGTATITAAIAEVDGVYHGTTKDFTVTVKEYIAPISGTWELVTDASKLQAGMEVIVAQYVEEDGTIYTMGGQKTNNRDVVESSVLGKTLTPITGTAVLTLVDAGNGTFALQAGNGNYLYAASSSANQLKEKNKIDADGQWTITIADNKATIKAEASSNRNWMQFNPNNGSPLFSCYAYDKPQKDIALYARVPDHTRTTSAGRYGTICLPGNIVKCLGATLYEVAGKDGLRVVFDEVLTPEAGMPYIFLAHNAEVLFYCGDETAAADNHNSLYGTFTVLQNSELDGMYMVQNNKIVKCNPANSGVAAYRAYFNGDELEALGSAPAPMPGRRRITMGTESENTTTGTEDVIAPEGQILKLIENGQLIIIRNGEKFNAQGIKF